MQKASKRHELKYVVDLSAGEAFVQQAEQYCIQDEHAGPDGYYETASIYYDTEDLRFFWDRQESVGYRRKVRLRSYTGGSGEPILFFEIKEKLKHLVSKKRCTIKAETLNFSLDDPSAVGIDQLIPYATPSIAREEIEYLHARLRLKPIVNVRYVRKALAAVCDATLRITIDKRLTAGDPVVCPYDGNAETFFLPPNQAILEIKSEHSLPLWLVSQIQRFEFCRTRYSKYCSAVEARNIPKQKLVSNFNDFDNTQESEEQLS